MFRCFGYRALWASKRDRTVPQLGGYWILGVYKIALPAIDLYSGGLRSASKKCGMYMM